MELFQRKAVICLLAITTVLTQSGLAGTKLLVDASKDGGEWWFPQGKEGFDQEKPHQGKQVADHMRGLGWHVEELARGDTVTVEMLTNCAVVLRPRPFFPYSLSEVRAYSSAINQGVGLVLLCQPSSRPDALARVFGLGLGLSQHVGTPTRHIRQTAFGNVVAGDGPWALIEEMPADWLPLASIADGNRTVYAAAYGQQGDGHVLCLGASLLRVAPSVLAEALQGLLESPPSLLSELRDAQVVTDAQSGPTAPHLVSPAAGAELSQSSDLEWRFEWQQLPDVRGYHLVVLGPSASTPLIDVQLATNSYVHNSSGGYVAGHNLKGWTWRVRAQDQNSRWGDWSGARQFNVTVHQMRKPTQYQEPTQYHIGRWVTAGLVIAVASGDSNAADKVTQDVGQPRRTASTDEASAVARERGDRLRNSEATATAEDLRIPVHEAVKTGDMEALRSILRSNAAAVTATNSAGETPLHVAVAIPNPAMVAALLAAKAPVDARTADGYTPLQQVLMPRALRAVTNWGSEFGFTNIVPSIAGILAARFRMAQPEASNLLTQVLATSALGDAAKDGDVVKVVQLLLTAGADPNAKDLTGFTVVHYASTIPQTNLLRTLLVPGANLSAKNVFGQTPLLVASVRGKQAAVKALLDKGADVNARDAQGNTALYYATWRGESGMVKCLLDHKANVESLNNNMETALNMAVRKGRTEVVALLLEHGAWIGNRPTAPDETVLHAAVRNGNLALIQLLLDWKAPVNVTDGAGFTPLLNAAERGNLEAVKLLANRGGDLTARYKAGGCAFDLAAGTTNLALLAWLLDKQGTNMLATSVGNAALANAAMEGRVAIVQFLLDKGVPANAPCFRQTFGPRWRQFPLHLAAKGPGAEDDGVKEKRFAPSRPGSAQDYGKIVSLLLASGAHVDEPDPEGRTPLHLAAGYSCMETARVLLANKASVRVRAKEGKSVLQQLAARGDAAMAELLLAHGAELESVDDYGFTPLRDAAGAGNSTVVKVLLEHKAEVNVRDRYRATPLHWAAMTTNVTTLALLLDAGADINAADGGKCTPLHQAAGAGRELVVSLLVERKADATLLDAASDTAEDVARKSGFPRIVTLLSACSVTQLADIRAKAAGGDVKAQTQLGAVLSLGKINAAKDEAEALKWWRKAAEQNSAEAQLYLADCYAKGRGVAKDDVEAVKWCRKAAEQNLAEAQLHLGFCYQNGPGVARDYVEAVKWYRMAAAQNFAQGQDSLGFCYQHGLGVAQDYAEALKLFRMAAAQNCPSGQNNLGFCYQHGLGVAQDYAEAVKLFRMAAAQNFAPGQNNLGGCYGEGQGVTKDAVEAVRWYRLSAAQNHAQAQFNLGSSYCDGYGVERDHVEAYAWYSLASRNMQPAASALDQLSRNMTSQQIQDGHKRTQELQVQIESNLRSSDK